MLDFLDKVIPYSKIEIMKQQFTALILFMSLIYATTSIAQNYQNVPVFYRANADNIGLEDGEEVFRVRSAWLNRLKDGRYNQIEITLSLIHI